MIFSRRELIYMRLQKWVSFKGKNAWFKLKKISTTNGH